MPEYSPVHNSEEYTQAAELFREYAASIGIDLGFQHFEEELQALKEMYASPKGGIILCHEGDEPVGCVAIRKQSENIAELKRMFVRTGHQHKGIGAALLERAINLAQELGYERIRLDTLDTMLPAIHLYERYGFQRIPAYYHNPIANAVYFEKTL